MHGGQLVFADDAFFQQCRALAVDLRREVARCPQRVKIEHAHHAVERGADLRAGHLLLLHETRQAHQRRVRQGSSSCAARFSSRNTALTVVFRTAVLTPV